MTSSPAAWRALALLSTARVADSAMAAIRRETRLIVSRFAHENPQDRVSFACDDGGVNPPATPDIRIPTDLLPADGRFGCGPSKVRPEALAALAATGTSFLGP